MVNKKHKPPSRIRYEKKYPVWSVRMPKEWIREVELTLKDTGQSRREFMEIALEKQAANFERFINKWFKAGVAKGKEDWSIQFPCKICGELVYILPNSECHQAVIEFLKERGWVHRECYEQ